MPDLSDIQACQSVKLAGADPSTGVETYWSAVDQYGSQSFTIRDANGNLLLGQKPMSFSLPVVFASDQTPLPVSPFPPADKKVSGTITSLNGYVGINCEGISSVIISLSGTWAATLKIEGTVDDVNWYPVTFIDLNTNSQIISINLNGLYQVPTAGYLKIRIIASSFTYGPVTVYMEGNQGQFSIFSIQSSQGFNSGFSFGDVSSATVTRKAVMRTAYTEQTTNARRSISSSSSSDSATGTGARQVKIIYFDQDGNGPYHETVTLNGTTYVNTVATNICYIEHMEVVSVGSSGSNVGTITLKAGTGGGGTTITTINPTDNRIYWAQHYVPIGHICRITGISCSHNGTTVGSGAIFTLFAKKIGVDNMPEQQVSDFVRLYGQSGTFSRVYQSSIAIPGPARILMYVTPESSSVITYRASMDYFE